MSGSRAAAGVAILTAVTLAGCERQAASGTAADAPGAAPATGPEQAVLEARGIPLLDADGLRFKDMNRNGALDAYEDWRLDDTARAADLVSQMTLAEKAGAMMHGTLPGATEAYDLEALRPMVLERGVNSFITRMATDGINFAGQNNAVQEIAEGARLGIPVTISTDPRNHFAETFGASVAASGFSQWPEVLGLAAIDDPELTRQFGAIARDEYRSVGIHMALSPQADLATEPRWPRIDGTFGEDPERAARQAAAYIEGFQGGPDGVTRDGVITVVKHWVGYGAPSEGGFDGHNFYGRHATLTEESLALHIRPFEAAFAAGAAGVMPTYSILQGVSVDGAPLEQVGAGFNAQLLTDLLRGTHGFDGLVLSDWAITNDCTQACMEGATDGDLRATIAMPWGVEDLSQTERFARGVQAGIDQFGGTVESQHLVAAAAQGLVTEARLDESVARIMALKFRQGLFETPFVDPQRTVLFIGAAEMAARAMEAQRRSIVLLDNAAGVLPLRAGTRVYLDGVDAEAAAAAGLAPVATPQEAEVTIARVRTPFELLHPNYFFGAIQHEGNLAFAPGQEDFDRIAALAAETPVVLAVHLDRPAVLTAIQPHAAAMLGVFGASDAALLDVLAGAASPQGTLPFELPRSMEAVEAQRPDLPHDSEAPLFAYGHGETY